MRRNHRGWAWSRLCLWIAAFLLFAGPARAETNVTHPYVGITCITRFEFMPWPELMHIALIDLTAPGIHFKVTPPGGTLDTIRQRTVDFVQAEHAALGINAHFFLPFPSDDTNANVVGLAASMGTVYSPFEPQPIGTDYVDQSYAILPFGPALNIDPFNCATIVHCDPSVADNKHVLEPVLLWNAVSGSAQIVSNGVKNIPTYTGTPGGLNALFGYSDQFSWYAYPRARTAIGLTEDNHTLVLFTVDEAGPSVGLTAAQVADILINDYKVYNALNLDGGGSTSMALRDPHTHVARLINYSSDAPTGRTTGSNLAVFSRPIFRPALAVSRSPICADGVLISWPVFAADWRLQQNSGLGDTGWVDVNALPQLAGHRLEVTVIPQTPIQFYRLIRPPETNGAAGVAP